MKLERFAATVGVTLGAAVLIGAWSGAAWSAPPTTMPPPPPPAPKKTEDNKDPTKSGPALSGVTQKRTSRLSARDTEKSLRASIKNQEQILQLEDRNSPSYAKQAIALADFYWDLAEFYGNRAYSEDIEKPLYEAEQKGDKEAVKKWKIEQQRALDFQKKYQEETITRYRDVLAKYKRADNRDQIRYFLAYNLVQMGRGEEGAEEYAKIITEFPESPYVPDALVNIGDYYFDINDFANAQRLFQKAQEEKYQGANVFGYSVYKEAWCLYNLPSQNPKDPNENYKLSLQRFIDVIAIADKRAQEGQTGAIPLRREAQNEMTLPYSKVRKPEEAVAFFKQYAPDRYLDICSRLARIYTEQNEFQRSSKLLKMLIAEARAGNIAGQDQRFMIVKFQRQIVDNAIEPGDKATTVNEIGELIRVFEEIGPNAPAEFLDSERGEIKRTILEVAQTYHTEYTKTLDPKTLEYTQRLYDEYLRVFRKDENAYQIAMNNALLMLATEKYEEAAAEFENVIQMNPEGQYADPAAERAVIAYLKTIQVKGARLKEEASDDLKPIELPPQEKRFVAAIDRWMALIARKGENPETKDNVPTARYAAAKVYYNHNQFPEAATRFADFLDKHPGHPFENDARRQLLSSYNLPPANIDKLREYANKFDAIPTLPQDLKDDIRTIKNAFNFQECQKIAEAKKPLDAAGCFEKYAREFPKEERAVAALYNASLNYFEAKRVEKALETQRALYEQHKNHELGPKALYAIGEIYRQTTVYELASQWYEFLVKNHPDHPLAEKALRYASIFRKTLGQHKEAIANLERYLKTYPKEANAPRVDLDIVFILEKQEKWGQVYARANAHLKRFPSAPPSVTLQVLNKRGLALLKQNKGKEAQAAFQSTVDYYNRLDERFIRDLELAGIAAVAESHFQLGEVDLQRSRAIKLEAATEAASKKALDDKLAILAQVKEKYEKVIGYQHPGWVIAASAQLGLAYQDLADAVENAPTPKAIVRMPEVVDAFRQLMADNAVKIRQNAIVNYRRALDTSKEFRWFNDYSERAERAIAQLDLTDLSVKEFRARPDHLTPNAGTPDFRGGPGTQREPALPNPGGN